MEHITATEFASLMEGFGSFEPKPHLAIAVSGGADSMCLCLLAHHWVKDRGGKITAFTVDHGLRKESVQEAAQVKKWLKPYGIEHHTLLWEKKSLKGNLQQAARKARYRLLEEACDARGILHLLTAHHADDQAETFLLRLSRGSGAEGLAAMPWQAEKNHIRVLRPFLDMPKSQLVTTLKHMQHSWIEDPSNTNDRFTRSRLRNWLAEEEGEALSTARLSDTAHHLGRARSALERETARLAVHAVRLYPEGYALLTPETLTHFAEECQLRLLSQLLCTVSGDVTPPRFTHLARALTSVQKNVSFSLHGCLAKPTKYGLLIMREPKAMESAVALTITYAMWDNRFRCKVEKPNKKLYIRALGAEGMVFLKKQKFFFPKHLPSFVLPTLPAFWHLETLACVPHLGYNAHSLKVSAHASFAPAKALAGQHFCYTLPQST